MKNVDCDVIQDLLPSYVDKISSEATNKLVEKHLLTCKKCCLTLQNMNKEVNADLTREQYEQIDFLKKYRKRNRIRIVIFAILLALCIIIIISWIGIFMQVLIHETHHYVDIDNFNVEYMYKEKAYGNDTLNVYLYSEKDKNKEINALQYTYFGEEIHLQITTKQLFNLPQQQAKFFSGTYARFNLSEKNNIKRIYIEDTKGKTREIWNKDMEVMTKEQFEEWYNNSYVPEEVKKLYNYDMTHGYITDTGAWRHLYSPDTMQK